MTGSRSGAPIEEQGFTLLELLVGLVILSLAATLMLAGISGISAMARRSSSGAADDATVSAAQIVLRDRLEHLEPINRGDVARPVADIDGTERTLDFTGPPPPGAGYDALQHYRLRLNAGGDVMLYRASTSNDRIDQAAPALAGWSGATILSGVRAISLAYYGDAGRQSGAQWQSFWRQRPASPDLVRIRISFADGDRPRLAYLGDPPRRFSPARLHAGRGRNLCGQVMSSSSILNADMGTVGRWLREGLQWWIGELAALVPERWRARGTAPSTIALYRGAASLVLIKDGQPLAMPPSRAPRPIAVAIAAPLALVHEFQMAKLGPAETRRMAALEADRLLPLPSAQLYVDAESSGFTPDNRMTVRVAGLPRSVADAVLAAAADADIAPTRIGIADPLDAGRIAFDFAPALRIEGKLPPRSRALPIWWSLVGIALAFNGILLIARDTQSVDRLSALVDAQAPAIAIGRTMQRRVQAADRLSTTTIARRRSHDPLGDLGAATRILADDVWVQRLIWGGGTIELSGYRQPSADVIAQLRRSPRFVNVRTSTSDVTAAVPIGEPFAVIADVRGDAR